MTVGPDRSRRLVADSASLLASTAGAAALSLAFVVAVARTAGPEARGVLAFVVAVPTLLSFAATLGLDAANLYFAGASPDRRPRLVTASLASGLVLGAAAAALAWALFTAGPRWAPGAVAGARLGAVLAATPFMTAHHLLTTLLIGSGRVGAANAVRMAIPAISVASFATLWAAGGGTTDGAIAAWLAGQGFGFVLAALVAGAALGVAPPRAGLALVPGLVRYGGPAHAGNLADIAVFRIDALILGAVRGPVELGLYAAAVNVAEVLLYLPTAVSTVLLPDRAARADDPSGGPTARIAALVAAASALAAAAAAIAAPAVIAVLFGAAFGGSVTPLRILAIAMVGMAVRRVLWADLAARRRQGMASAAAIATLAVVVGLDFALIPDYGAAGAAWASAAAYWAGGALMVALFVRVVPASERGGRIDVAGDARKLASALAAILTRRPPGAGTS